MNSEIAATAVQLGVDTTLAGRQQAPMELQLGSQVAALLRELHTRRGVRLRLGTGVTALETDDGRVSGVRLATGEVLAAEVVVIAFGATPATEWLAATGCHSRPPADAR
jgi:NAD(P)H-nitrite reductase large subunit